MKIDIVEAKLTLANGRIFTGYAPNYQTPSTFGEVVFNTGMTGYEETLTDPSYSGQLLTFTYPIIGNYGVHGDANFESSKIHAKGIICQSLYTRPSHYLSNQTFLQWLHRENIPIIWGIDTRALTQLIREDGVIEGAISFIDEVIPAQLPDSMQTNWVKLVSSPTVSIHGSGKYKIILVDCGSKKNILNSLLKFDVTVMLVPYDYDYNREHYDGVFLSNGPGDPKQCVSTIDILRRAMANAKERVKPIYGICLGAQLMALAIGANTYKLKYGHRGQNQPCILVKESKCYLTSQNHGYAVDEASIPDNWIVSFKHLNDSSIAGIMHKELPFASVQFHPEAHPGPHDSYNFFEQFIDQVKKYA